MSTINKCVSAVVVAACLCASSSWAASLQFPHRARQVACPTAVENAGQNNAISWGENKDASKAAGVADTKTKGSLAPTGKGQNTTVVPAAKQEKAPGQLAGEAGKTEAGAK